MITLLILIILIIVFWEHILGALILLTVAVFGLFGITIDIAKSIKPKPLTEAQKLGFKKWLKSLIKVILILLAFILLQAIQVLI